MYVKPHVCCENPTMNKDSYYYYYYYYPSTISIILNSFFEKKSNTKGWLFFCTICLDYQCQASCQEKAKNLPVFCKWYNSIPFLFLVPKKYQYHLMEVFHQNFVQMVTAHRREEDEQTDLLKTMEAKKNCHYNRFKEIYQNNVPYTIQPEKRLL